MTSTNIAIKKEAYDFLKSMKTEKKSFSDVILSFKKKKTIMDFFGVLKDKKDWADYDKIREEANKEDEKRQKEFEKLRNARN